MVASAGDSDPDTEKRNVTVVTHVNIDCAAHASLQEAHVPVTSESTELPAPLALPAWVDHTGAWVDHTAAGQAWVDPPAGRTVTAAVAPAMADLTGLSL